MSLSPLLPRWQPLWPPFLLHVPKYFLFQGLSFLFLFVCDVSPFTLSCSWHGWLLPILRSQIISLPSLTILSIVLPWNFFFPAMVFQPSWLLSVTFLICFTIFITIHSIAFLSSFPHLNVSFLRIRRLFVLFNLLCLIDCKCSVNNCYINK